MNRKFLGKVVVAGVLICSLITSSLFMSPGSNEDMVQAKSNAIQRIEQEMAQLKKRAQEVAQKRNQLQAQIKGLEEEKRQHEADIMALDLQLNETYELIAQKETEIAQTEAEAKQAAIELAEAETRVAEREELVKTRIRATYEAGGTISYLEVLLGSASFGEFLVRLDFLSMIMEQDHKILQDFIRDKEIVEEKKLAIEQLLVRLEGQLEELESLKARQQREQNMLKDLVVRIQETQQELLELDEEMQQEMLEYANRQSALQKELDKLRFDGIFTWPVPDSYRITSHFGLRKDPFTGRERRHAGTDIGAPVGTDIVAAASGVVSVAEYHRSYGNVVIIEHGNNIRTLYAHIRHGGIKVKPGQHVERGQKIAEVGSTGRSTGPHLHFEVHENGVQVDPMKYLKN